MPTCEHCGATVSDGARNCDNCGTAINSNSTSMSTSQNPQESLTQPDASSSDYMILRLEKAMRRSELLGYAAAGLAIAILVAIIAVAFL